jgi:hypothetical protein
MTTLTPSQQRSHFISLCHTKACAMSASSICAVCYDELPNGDRATCCANDAHRVCRTCAKSTILADLRNERPLLPIRCPGVDEKHERCTIAAADSVVRQVLCDQQHLDEYERVQLAMATQTAEPEAPILWTPCCNLPFWIDRRGDCSVIPRVLACPFFCSASMCSGCERRLTSEELALAEQTLQHQSSDSGKPTTVKEQDPAQPAATAASSQDHWRLPKGKKWSVRPTLLGKRSTQMARSVLVPSGVDDERKEHEESPETDVHAPAMSHLSDPSLHLNAAHQNLVRKIAKRDQKLPVCSLDAVSSLLLFSRGEGKSVPSPLLYGGPGFGQVFIHASRSEFQRWSAVAQSKPITTAPHDHAGPLCFREQLHTAWKTDPISALAQCGESVTDEQLRKVFSRTLDQWAPHCPGCRRLGLKSGTECNRITCGCGVEWCFVCSRQMHHRVKDYLHARRAHPERTALMVVLDDDGTTYRPVNEKDDPERALHSGNHHSTNTENVPAQHRFVPSEPGKVDTLCPSMLDAYIHVYAVEEFITARTRSVAVSKPVLLGSSVLSMRPDLSFNDGVEIRLLVPFLRLRALLGLCSLQGALSPSVFRRGLLQLKDWSRDALLCEKLGEQKPVAADPAEVKNRKVFRMLRHLERRWTSADSPNWMDFAHARFGQTTAEESDQTQSGGQPRQAELEVIYGDSDSIFVRFPSASSSASANTSQTAARGTLVEIKCPVSGKLSDNKTEESLTTHWKHNANTLPTANYPAWVTQYAEANAASSTRASDPRALHRAMFDEEPTTKRGLKLQKSAQRQQRSQH